MSISVCVCCAYCQAQPMPKPNPQLGAEYSLNPIKHTHPHHHPDTVRSKPELSLLEPIGTSIEQVKQFNLFY